MELRGWDLLIEPGDLSMLNKLIAECLPYLPKTMVWQFSKKYIAGERIIDAVDASKALNRQQIKITLDLLGEFITSLNEAEKNKNDYLDLIRKIESSGIDGHYSIKPTMFGLLLDKEACYNHLRDIVKTAAGFGSFIRMDMEDSSCTSLEIELFQRLRKEFPKNVGLAIQAYLKRTKNDLIELAEWHTDSGILNFRLCKGIYVEPSAIAYQGYHEINRHYIEDLEFMLKNGIYAAIATHDALLVNEALRLIEAYNVPEGMVEFQMLYGVTPKLRQSIVAKGHTMRVYVPFGKQWFGYSTRRLKENPRIVNHLIKALLVKR